MPGSNVAPPVAESLSSGSTTTRCPTIPVAESSVATAAATTVMVAVAVAVCPEASVTV